MTVSQRSDPHARLGHGNPFAICVCVSSKEKWYLDYLHPSPPDNVTRLTQLRDARVGVCREKALSLERQHAHVPPRDSTLSCAPRTSKPMSTAVGSAMWSLTASGGGTYLQVVVGGAARLLVHASSRPSPRAQHTAATGLVRTLDKSATPTAAARAAVNAGGRELGYLGCCARLGAISATEQRGRSTTSTSLNSARGFSSSASSLDPSPTSSSVSPSSPSVLPPPSSPRSISITSTSHNSPSVYSSSSSVRPGPFPPRVRRQYVKPPYVDPKLTALDSAYVITLRCTIPAVHAMSWYTAIHFKLLLHALRPQALVHT